MVKTLLEKAKEIEPLKRGGTYSEQEIELAIAWMMDEVTLTAVAKVLGASSPGAIISKMAVCIREAYRLGIIKVK